MKKKFTIFGVLLLATPLIGCSGGGDEPAKVGEVVTSPKGAAEAAANGGVPKPRPANAPDLNN